VVWRQDTQNHKDQLVSFELSVVFFIVMLSVVKLSIVKLSVVKLVLVQMPRHMTITGVNNCSYKFQPKSF
jgi:hypothetical protein